MPSSAHVTALQPTDWLAQAEAHARTVARYTEPYVRRRAAGQEHPVEDFLFTYYTLKPAQLSRWHPGAGVVLLADTASTPALRDRLTWTFYREPNAAEREALGLGVEEPAAIVDLPAFLRARRSAVEFAEIILSGTAGRPAQFGCFGLHEWAMAYRSAENGLRHERVPLRLGPAGTDAVVEEHNLRCTHFDAFRFYAPQAAPRNDLQLRRETQRLLEQPGCLHANMDLYKWAYKLLPLLPSELVLECFALAWRIRIVDMRASPYLLTDWGYEPIAIESAEGKAEYVAQQRGFAQEAAVLRARLLNELRGRQRRVAAAVRSGRPGLPRRHGRAPPFGAESRLRR